MKNFLLCALLVLVPMTASAFIRNLPVFRKPPTPAAMSASPIESKLRAFLAADDVEGFSQWLAQATTDVNATVGKHDTSLLHLTARSGKVLFVDRLLQAGAEVDITDSSGLTPLDDAEFWGHPAVIVRLLEAGAMTVAMVENEEIGDAEAMCMRRLVHKHLTPKLSRLAPRINYLTVCGDWLTRNLVQVSLFAPQEQKERVLRPFVGGRTRLQEAIVQGKLDVARLLLIGGRYKRTVHEVDDRGWQAVHYAAFKGNSEALTLLRAKGADINAVVHSSQHTPLTLAALVGQTTTVQQLLTMGANPAVRNHLDMDALQLAVLGMHIETVAVLLQHGLSAPTIDVARKLAEEKNATRRDYAKLLELFDNAMPSKPVHKNKHGNNELQQAVWEKDITRLKEILARDNSLLHESDNSGWTVAHDASFLGVTDMMELLYDAGADFKVVSQRGDTPALIAAARGNLDALAFLVKIDANLSATTDDGQNILHLAVEGNHVHLVRWLVHKQVNLRLRTKEDESALDIAKRLGNQKIISILDIIEIGFYENSGEFYIGPADKS